MPDCLRNYVSLALKSNRSIKIVLGVDWSVLYIVHGKSFQRADSIFLFQQALLNCNFWTFHCLSLVCFQGLLDVCMSSLFLRVFFSIHIFSSDISLFPSFCTTFYFLFLLQYFPCSYAYSSLVLISKILLNFLLCFLPKYLFTCFFPLSILLLSLRKHLLLIIWIFF